MNIPKYAPVRQSDLGFLINGVDIFYPQYSRFLKTAQELESVKKTYQGLEKDDFDVILFSFTEQKTVEAAISFLYEVFENPEVEQTIPVNLQELVDIKNTPSSEYSQTREEMAKRVDVSIQRLQEIRSEGEKSPRSRMTPFDDVNAKARGENIFIKANGEESTIDMTAKENQELRRVIRLVNQDPKKFYDEAVKRTQEVLVEKTHMAPETALATAEAYTNNFIVAVSEIDPDAKKVVIDNTRFEIQAALANEENANKIFLDPAQAKAFSESMSANFYRELNDSITTAYVLSNALGVDVSKVYIHDQIRNTTVSTVDLGKSSASVSVTELMNEISQSSSTQQAILKHIWDENPDVRDQLTKPELVKIEQEAKKIADKIQSKNKAFKWLRYGKYGGMQPKRDFNLEYFTNKVPQANMPKLPQSFSSITAMPFSVGGFNTSNSLLSPILNTAFRTSIKRLPQVVALNRIVTGYSAKIAAKAAATRLGAAFLANAVPVIGQIISIASLVSAGVDTLKILYYKTKGKLPYILGGAFLGGFFLTGAPLFLVAAAVPIGFVGVVPFATFMGSMLIAFGSLAIGSILVPLLIILVGIPITVAIIIYIINTSAYLVPPSSSFVGAGAVVSPYIKVTKIASSETHPDKGSSSQLEFENSDLPLDITYTITITALKGNLTHVELRETCSVVKEFSPPGCPDISPPLPSSIPDISPATPYTFTYKRSFDAPKFNDTLTIDTITVTADTPEASGVTSSGSASVKIGDPPEDCPFGWPILPEGGESTLAIYQGPLTSGSNTTHDVVEAIDIRAGTGHNVSARHTGVATERRGYGNYGDMVEIASTCVLQNGNQVDFKSRYGHLSSISVNTGQIVHMGQSIGSSGSSGTGTPHLHYEFSPRNTVPMDQPYIPKHVDYGCADWIPGNRCDVTIP